MGGNHIHIRNAGIETYGYGSQADLAIECQKRREMFALQSLNPLESGYAQVHPHCSAAHDRARVYIQCDQWLQYKVSTLFNASQYFHTPASPPSQNLPPFILPSSFPHPLLHTDPPPLISAPSAPPPPPQSHWAIPRPQRPSRGQPPTPPARPERRSTRPPAKTPY